MAHIVPRFAVPVLNRLVWLTVSLLVLGGCRMDGISNALALDGGTATGAPQVLVKDRIRVHALSPNPAQSLLVDELVELKTEIESCLLYTSPSPRDKRQSRMPSSA